MSKMKDTTTENKTELAKTKLTPSLKQKFVNISQKLNKTQSALLRIAIRDYVKNHEEYNAVVQEQQKKKGIVLKKNSLINQFNTEETIKLPSELVEIDEIKNEAFLERVSNILSLNKMDEAYQFAIGLKAWIDSLPKNCDIIFTETDAKGRISTKLARNVFGVAIVQILLSAMDNGHNIYTMTESKNPVHTEDLFALLSEGISTSVHERTKVYDNLFYEKYNKSHFNQWLQWSFGLSRRDPVEEYNRILRKNPNIVIDKSDIDERCESAKSYLRKRYKLFGLTENGLQLALQKMDKFIELLHNYSGDYDPVEKCKIAQDHDLFIEAERKCPLGCGL